MSPPTPQQSFATAAEELLQPDRRSNRYEQENEDSRLWGSRRSVVVIFIFFGFIYHYLLKGNLSIAIVEMTSNKTVVVGNQTITQAPEFEWDSKTKGWILSIFYYGYMFSAIGGYMSTKLGGGTVYGLGILVTAVLTMMSPFALKANLYLFIAGRIAEGIFEGFSYASSCDLCSRWIPKHELPLLVTFSQSGIYLGSAITLPLCGYIAHRWGWPLIFYFSGIVALIWCLFYFTMVKNDPASDRNISEGELRYIKRTVGCDDTTNITYPWKKIITCKPLWALCAGKFTYSWAYSFLVNCMPLYVKDITNKTTAEVGFLSGIPSYANMIALLLIGYTMHCFQNKFSLDVTKLYKWIIGVAFLVGGLLFILISFTSFTGSMVCFMIILMTLSASIMVLQLVIIHMAPDHAGLVAGISAFWFTLSSLGNPLAIGYMVTNHTWQEWNASFILSGIILIIGAVITLLFGSSENQNWSSLEYQKAKQQVE